MLDDRERKLLFEIEHRLLLEDPELVGSFRATPQHPPQHAPQRSPHGHRLGAVVTTVAGLTLCAVLWIGPRPFTDGEAATRGAAGPPRVRPKTPGATALPVPRRPLLHETRGR